MSFSIGNLKIDIPIVQGGMGVGVSLSGLASAVANEGGVGVISCAGLGLIYNKSKENFLESSIFGLKEEIRKAREKAKGVIGVNIMVALSNFTDMVKTAVESGTDVIFSGAGLPLDLPSYVKNGEQTKLVPIVSSGRAAKLITDTWINRYDYTPDALVLEGPKAGGHLGYKRDQIFSDDSSLEIILPQVLEVAKYYEQKRGVAIPVIAGGGITNGYDMRRILDMGASAVQMGSRFVTTTECDASEAFKMQYINAGQSDISIIESPVGMPGRAIFGEFLERVKQGLEKPKKCPFKCIRTCDYSKSPYCIMMALYNAFKGNFKKGYAFAGSEAYKADKIISVKETISILMQEFKSTYASKSLSSSL